MLLLYFELWDTGLNKSIDPAGGEVHESSSTVCGSDVSSVDPEGSAVCASGWSWAVRFNIYIVRNYVNA